MARLTADFWVRAYLRRLQLADIPAYVVAHGDETAGSVIVKSAHLDGTATLYQREFDLLEGTRQWREVAQGPEAELDARLSRERARDPDLWIVEVEDRQGRTLLDEPGLDM